MDEAGCLALAESLHENQFRRNGDPYITHPRAVGEHQKSLGAPSVNVKVGYLHDTIEDCGVTSDKLIEFGVDEDVAWHVDTLSRRKGENYFDYIARISKCPVCSAVKRSDLIHNMSTLDEGSMKDKYRFALHFLMDK